MPSLHPRIEIPTDLPWDPPGSELRQNMTAAFEECGENCVYLLPGERDWDDHDAGTALFVIGGGVSNRTRNDIPGLRDVLRSAFKEHSEDRRFDGSGRLGYCFEGDPGYGEEHAIVALQALWKFGPRILT